MRDQFPGMLLGAKMEEEHKREQDLYKDRAFRSGLRRGGSDIPGCLPPSGQQSPPSCALSSPFLESRHDR